ncbi:MAG: hypothetical protein WEB00_14885 [Dehalococcoidia bacterium]
MADEQKTAEASAEGVVVDTSELGSVRETERAQGDPLFDPTNLQVPPLDFRWSRVPTERPPRPKIGPEGFLLRQADYGSYGWAPDHWPYENDTPRGSFPARDRGLPAPYTIYDKYQVWAENSADLYEQAVRERWSAANDIRWGTLEPLSETRELALDQIYTWVSEQAYNSSQWIMRWLKEISYGYHEVKLYLATQTFDHARHTEVFRKRALANGGNLGVETPGFLNRTVAASFKFTELVVYINIIRSTILLGLMETIQGLDLAQADRQIAELTARDLRRHISYGSEHLRYFLQMHPEKRSEVENWLLRGEVMVAADFGRDGALRTAMILALGDTVTEGKEKRRQMLRLMMKRYLEALTAGTVYRRVEKMAPELSELGEETERHEAEATAAAP